MKQQIKEDWIINNQNVFGLPKEISLSLSAIQYEILNQIEDKNIKSISDYLGAKIDITKELRLTKKLTIGKVLADFLGFEGISLLKHRTVNCCLILSYLQLSLLKEYYTESNKNILTISEYEKQYSILLNSFLSSSIDTDVQDFIKAEKMLCDNLIIELRKPIYNEIDILCEVLDEPCDFKKNLTNSIDKRKKILEQMTNEKYPKTKILFRFIEYLHSNIEAFNQYNDLIKELQHLKKKRNQLKPRSNYKDKLQYDEVQAEFESKFKILQDNTANLIKAKVRELNVCDFDNEPNYNFNGIESEIRQLKDNFSNEDLPEIFKHKSQYLEYRSQTHGTFLSLQFFFDELDEITKSLFEYFKEDTEKNEYKTFERNEIEVNSIADLITAMNYGVNGYVPLDSNFKPRKTNNTIKSENIFLNAKHRIDKRPTSEAKNFALSVYFENISTFIDYYTNEAKASDKGLGQIADLFLNKCKNRLADCDTENELRSLLKDCLKGKEEIFNNINNFYEIQYKKEFNFFSFNEHNSFEWQEKQNTITHIKYYLEYKCLVNIINEKLSVIQKKENYLASYLGLKPEFPFYQLDFIPKYYESKLKIYLAERKKILGSAFVQNSEIEIFKNNEIQECKNVISHYSELFKNRSEKLENHSAIKGKKAYKIWLEALSNETEFKPQVVETKAEILKEYLSQFGFFELEKIKVLSEESRVSIIQKISECGLPYAIAMFDYLQFIQYLEKNHFDSKYKLNKEVSKWFCKDKEGRAVKGNISSLLKNTAENKNRYTAYRHIENVKKDYEQLK